MQDPPQDPQCMGREVAALLAAQRANLYRGLSLGLLPALEGLARAIGQQSAADLVDLVDRASELEIAARACAHSRALVDWGALEHLLLAAPLRQAAGYLATTAKLTRVFLAAAVRSVSESRRPDSDGAVAPADNAVPAVLLVGEQQVPLRVLRAMRAGSRHSSRLSSGRSSAAGGNSSGTSTAAANPQPGSQEQQQQLRRRVEVVSLLVATRLPTALLNWTIASEGDLLTTPAASEAAVALVLSVLEWVPVLVLAHLLALERGDAKAAAEWRSFIVVEVNPLLSIAKLVTGGSGKLKLSREQQLCLARAAGAMSAGLHADVVRNDGHQLLADVFGSCLSAGVQAAAGACHGMPWDLGEPGAAARAEVLAALRAGGGSSSSSGSGRQEQDVRGSWITPVAVEDVALLLPPAEVRRRLRLCANVGCVELQGAAEACVRLAVACPGCGAVRYCSSQCAGQRSGCVDRPGITCC